MPINSDRYMARKTRTSKVHFALIGGPEADTSPGVTPVLDSNNVVPSPNGTEMSPRDGIEIRKRYRLTTDTPGRKALVVETSPPDVQLGFLFMIIDTANGGNKIEKGQFMRDRTQLPFESNASIIFLGQGSTPAIFPPDTLGFEVFRVGDLSGERTVGYRTRNGTAVAGTDYTAVSGILTFNPQSTLETINGVDIFAPGSGKFFFVELFDPGPGVVIGTSTASSDLPQFSSTVVNIA